MSSVNIKVKATGEIKSAQYINTSRYNKRFSVEGTVYSDKKFNSLFEIIPDEFLLPLHSFKIHVPNFLKEVFDNYPSNGGALKMPANILRKYLVSIGERSAQINDPVLNAIMCEMAIYSVADPDSQDYNDTIVNECLRNPEYLKWRLK